MRASQTGDNQGNVCLLPFHTTYLVVHIHYRIISRAGHFGVFGGECADQVPLARTLSKYQLVKAGQLVVSWVESKLSLLRRMVA